MVISLKDIKKNNYVRELSYYWNSLRGLYWMVMANCCPQLNAISEMKRQKQINLIRPVKIDKPLYFNEKMLWLKYNLYNKSHIVAQCYNKYEVRKYLESKGLSSILNQLYFVSPDIKSIPWDKLPDSCVIKLSNGYYGHVFKREGETFNIENAKEILKRTQKRCSFAFKISGDLFAYKTTPVFICEKFIKADKPNSFPSDYKFHCFHGKPMFLEYIHDRSYDNKEKFFSSAFIDIINMVDRYDLEGEASPCGKIELPQSFETMVIFAEILSADFPYVRVDFYEEDGKPVFGELTFTPYHLQTKKSLVELGKLINLDDINRYREILL